MPADIRISLKRRGGKTHRVEVIQIPMTKRFWIRRDGRKSTRMSEATASQVAAQIRRWLVGSLDLNEQECLDLIALCEPGSHGRHKTASPSAE